MVSDKVVNCFSDPLESAARTTCLYSDLKCLTSFFDKLYTLVVLCKYVIDTAEFKEGRLTTSPTRKVCEVSPW